MELSGPSQLLSILSGPLILISILSGPSQLLAIMSGPWAHHHHSCFCRGQYSSLLVVVRRVPRLPSKPRCQVVVRRGRGSRMGRVRTCRPWVDLALADREALAELEGVICVGGGDLYLDELRFDPPERFITRAELRNEPPRHRSY